MLLVAGPEERFPSIRAETRSNACIIDSSPVRSKETNGPHAIKIAHFTRRFQTVRVGDRKYFRLSFSMA